MLIFPIENRDKGKLVTGPVTDPALQRLNETNKFGAWPLTLIK